MLVPPPRERGAASSTTPLGNPWSGSAASSSGHSVAKCASDGPGRTERRLDAKRRRRESAAAMILNIVSDLLQETNLSPGSLNRPPLHLRGSQLDRKPGVAAGTRIPRYQLGRLYEGDFPLPAVANLRKDRKSVV